MITERVAVAINYILRVNKCRLVYDNREERIEITNAPIHFTMDDKENYEWLPLNK